MVKLIRWSLLAIFFASLSTAVLVRSNGYTDVATDNGRYFVTYRSARYEVDQIEFEQTRRRNQVNAISVATMMLSLFSFIGFESVRFGAARHVASRSSGSGPRVRVLKLPIAPGRGPANDRH